jgi:DNA-binding FadR family transcriptional regulator
MAQADQTGLGALFSEVRPVRSFEDVAQQIQRAIASGQLKDGDRLPNERDLGAMFGVSRATLREALRVLEGAGIVKVRRGVSGGIFVAEPNADQVAKALEALIRFRGATAAELAEFRGSFEAETAYWAAKRATPAQCTLLVDIAAQYAREASVPGTPWATLVDLDVSFHEQVARASQNQIRVAIMLAIHRAIYDASLALDSRADLSFREAEAAELSAIASAISRRRVRLAKHLMRTHVSWNAQAEIEEEVRLKGDAERGRSGR